MSNFFRKSALEKLSTPEKLDQLIKVTSPKGWIALATIGLALVIAILWSVTGTVKTKLNVIGVIQGGEVHEVVSTSQGQLMQMYVAIGDTIKKGQIIAEIEQPELLQQIQEAKAIIGVRQHELSQIYNYGSQDNRVQGDLANQRQISINAQIATEKRNIDFLTNQLKMERDLLAKGLITNTQINSTQQQIEASRNNIERLKSQLVETASNKQNIGINLSQKVSNQSQVISEAQRNLAYLEDRYDNQTKVRSPFDGVVIELLTDKGIVVGQGSPLFKLKNTDNRSNKLRGILYIPSQDGKKIKEGMEAYVVPSTIQPQEYGFIKAKVTYISDYPVTQKGMMTSVNNDQIVQGLLAMGAPFEVYVEFEKDPSSYSGFDWTSAKGPNIQIKEGTSCMGKITIKSDPPITTVIPALKKFFDIY